MMKPSGRDLAFLGELAEEGKLRSIIDSSFSLEELPLAHKRSESGRAKGKIIIKIR